MQYTPAVRAQQLADVALAVYERGGPGIHVPLDSSYALVAVLKVALEREAKERSGKHWQVQKPHVLMPISWAKTDESRMPHCMTLKGVLTYCSTVTLPREDKIISSYANHDSRSDCTTRCKSYSVGYMQRRRISLLSKRCVQLQAGRDLSAALMEGFLAASEAKDQDTFPYLLVSSQRLEQAHNCGCLRVLIRSA